MATLIKNQIIKHLSKFARNLTPDQISVEILRGKSQLKNIELNEDVLSEALELPGWLRIRKATCNRVSVKVPWTKLKTCPVEMYMDEIHVHVELSAHLRPQTANLLSGYTDSSYGFANKVAENMSLYINSLEIHFNAGTFGGSIMLSRLSVDSRSPGWQKVSDLRQSRVTDTTLNQSLLFKQISFQLLRIEASAQTERSTTNRAMINAPLRLITTNGRCRIRIKKSTMDGSVIGGQLQLILEEILWVATLPQVFYRHISELINAAVDMRRIEQSSLNKRQNQGRRQNEPVASSVFKHFDFNQTSYHLYVGKIDLHLCDDANTATGYPSDWNIVAGAVQVSLWKLSVDLYPNNIANAPRIHWVRYEEESGASEWLQTLLERYLTRFAAELDGSARTRLARLWAEMRSSNCVIRLADLSVQCVSDTNSKRDSLSSLITSDRRANSSKTTLPIPSALIHIEFASFYHLATESLPVPPNATHAIIGPLRFRFDQRTIRWLLFVYGDICTALDVNPTTVDTIPTVAVNVELIMPQIQLEIAHLDTRIPTTISLNVSSVVLTNTESGDMNELTELIQLLDSLNEKTFYREMNVSGNEFPLLPMYSFVNQQFSFTERLSSTSTNSNFCNFCK